MSDAEAPGRTPFPARRVIPFGFPLVLGMGGHALFNLVDLWIVGSIGPAALAAVTVASYANTLAMVVMQGVTDGSVAIISRAVGAGDRSRAVEATRQSLLLVGVLAVVLGVPPWLFARPLAAMLGASGEALEPSTLCLGVMSIGSGTMFLLMQVTGALRAFGFGHAPALLLLGSNFLNAVLAYGLVYGKWGLPEMGVVGAAWGTVLARGLVGVAGLLLLRAAPISLRLRGPGPSRDLLLRQLRIGMPAAGQWMVRLAGVLVILTLLSPRGAEALAAYGIGGRLDTLAIFATVGWGAAAATGVGQGLGACDPRGAARAAWWSAALGVLTMSAAAALFHHFAPALVRVISRDGDEGPVRVLGVEYIRTIVLAYPAVALTVVLSLALSGAGSVKTALVLEGGVLLGLQLPLYLAAAPRSSSDDLSRLWWSVVGCQWLLGLAYCGVFAWGRWKRRVL